VAIGKSVFTEADMGLFDWMMGKKKIEIAPERIWMTRSARNEGIRKQIAKAVADPEGPQVVIVVAHFNDCLEQLQAAIADFDPDHVLLTRADALAGRTPSDLIGDESRSILIIVGERHPLPSHNETVIVFARSLPCRSRIVHHVSLEDPLLKRFSSDWVKNVLQRLGMKEDEAIESKIFTRRFQSALKKIESTAIGDAPANTVEEWLARNCP
jgi:hypothetical protein